MPPLEQPRLSHPGGGTEGSGHLPRGAELENRGEKVTASGLGWLGTPRPSVPEHHPKATPHPRPATAPCSGRGEAADGSGSGDFHLINHFIGRREG